MKSKYDLHHFKAVKIPIDLVKKLERLYGNEWAEKVRDATKHHVSVMESEL
jgi:hypothetical protein